MSGPVPTDAVSPKEVEGLMRAEPEEMAMDHKTEAQLLTAMASATSQAEQERLAAELSALREGRAVQARAHDEAMWAEATLEEAPVTPHRAPYSRSTMDTDWLGSYEAAKVDTGEAEKKMRAEASTWYSHLHPGVKEHPDEVLIQAAGLSEVLASQYGAASARAEVAFLEQVRHHAATEGMPIPDPATIRPEPYEHGQYDGSTETSASDTPSLAEGDEPADDEAPSQGTNQSQNLDAATWPSQDDATWNNGDEPPGQKTSKTARRRRVAAQFGSFEELEAHVKALMAKHPDLVAAAEAAYERQDQAWFDAQSTEDLKIMWEIAGSSFFVGWDDEVYDALAGRPNNGFTASRKTASTKTASGPTVDQIMAYEQGEMESEEEVLAFFQALVDSGLAWSLQGHYGRTAQALIDAGLVTEASRKAASSRKHAVDVNVIDLSVCGDCLMAAANGYDPHEWGRTASPEPWAEWVGYPGHPVAGDATDGSFSHSMCEGCGSRLGGDRYPAYWMEPKSAAHASRRQAAKMVFDEWYGEISYAQRAAYRKYNVSPADHDQLVDMVGNDHATIVKAVKAFSPNGMFSAWALGQALRDYDWDLDAAIKDEWGYRTSSRKTAAGMRPATWKEEQDWYNGYASIPGAEETEHGLLVPATYVNPMDVATCGTCGRSWDAEAHPTPAGLCPFCNGDERAAAPYEVRDGKRVTASRKTAGEYKGGSPKEGDTATCHKDGGKIQFFAGEWMHLKGTGDSHNDVYPASKAKESSRRTAAEGNVCATCGDKIAKDPSGENPSTWHHDNGESHDHEAKPASKESSRRAASRRKTAYEGAPEYGDRAACGKCGRDIEFVVDGWRDRWWDRGGNFSCPAGGTHEDASGKPIKAIHLTQHKQAREITVSGLADKQAAVEGLIEPITLSDGSTMYVNEEYGYLPNSEVNWAACDIAGLGGRQEFMFRNPIKGPVLIVGPLDEEGNDTDVTDAARRWVQRVGREAGVTFASRRKESSLKRAASRIRVGDQDKPALKALATLDSVEDDFEGISGRRVVEHLLAVGQMDESTRRALRAALEVKAAKQVLHDTRTLPGQTITVTWNGGRTFTVKVDGEDHGTFDVSEVSDEVLVGGETSATLAAKAWVRRNLRTASRKQAAVGDQCWGCGGKGYVRTPMGSDWDDPYGEQFMEVTCSTCGGSGVVNEPTDYPLADDPIFTDRWASRRKTASKVSPDDLNDKVEFGGPFRVGPDGDVTDEHGVFAPEVFFLPGQQGPNDLEVGSNDWEVWSTGRSGQHAYRGGIMHPSEFLGGGMAKDLLSEPGVYVLTEPIDLDDMGGDPIGWVVLKHKFA